jgi:hypothetical protein
MTEKRQQTDPRDWVSRRSALGHGRESPTPFAGMTRIRFGGSAVARTLSAVVALPCRSCDVTPNGADSGYWNCATAGRHANLER